MKDVSIVVPTVRRPEVLLEYLRNAESKRFDTRRIRAFVITEDAVDKAAIRKMLKQSGIDGEVYGESERTHWFHERNLSKYASLIPRKSHAETSFGLLATWEDPSLTSVIFVDDDTAPVPAQDFFGSHLANLEFEGTIREVSSSGSWVNVLFESFAEHGLYPRGYPYSQMFEKTDVNSTSVRRGEVILSQGLWTQVPDLDAVRILSQGGIDGLPSTRLEPRHYNGNFVVARGHFTTVCSMNLCVRREVIPAFYQLPMDDNPWNVGRFDDIWSGVILKCVSDKLGKRLLCGQPLVEHHKFPRSTFRDLRSEVPALEENETLFQRVSALNLIGETYAALYRSVGQALSKDGNSDFVRYAAERMCGWVELVEQLG